MRLSVFRGGASAEAARQVTGATVDVLAELIDMALLRRLPNGRYEIHELLRQFAAEQLASATQWKVGKRRRGSSTAVTISACWQPGTAAARPSAACGT